MVERMLGSFVVSEPGLGHTVMRWCFWLSDNNHGTDLADTL
jgi:hypothetical protein